MEQDVPIKTETQPDETDGDITMAEVNPIPSTKETEVKLEDLFADIDDDDDDDDELPTTTKPSQSQPGLTSSLGPSSSPEQE